MSRLTRAQLLRLQQQAEARQRWLPRVLDAITRATGIRPVGLIFIGFVVGAWVVGFIVGGKPVFLLAYGAAAVIAVAWGIGRRPLPVTGSRTDPSPRVREGDPVTITVELEASRAVANLVLEEQVPSMLGDPARLAVASLAANQRVEHTYSFVAWRRGSYQLGPLVAHWGDPFGLTQRELRLAETFELLVHPRVEPVEDHPLTRLWEDPPFRPPISRPWPHGMEFYGMREYVPGDDPRRIVWRAYARTGDLLVRESEQGITDKLVIVFDQDAKNHSQGIVSESFEAACRAVGSLGVHHLREGYSVILEGTTRKLAGPLRGAMSHIELLDQVARAAPEPGSLSATFDRMLLTTPRDAHVVVVTPLLDAQAAARLRVLVNRGQSVVVAALMWLDEAVDSLASAASLGVRVVEIGPKTDLATAFRHQAAGKVR